MNVLEIALGIMLGMYILHAWLYDTVTPDALTIDSGKWWRADYDVTDGSQTGVRSGLTIYVDYGTGVQYVSVMGGGITPRLDRDGKVMTFEGR